MAYRLTRKAAADIRHIFTEGLALFGVAQAERYHARLQQTFELLADNPGLARRRPELTPPARVHPLGSHVILSIEDAESGILIVRVRHSREDWVPMSEGDALS